MNFNRTEILTTKYNYQNFSEKNTKKELKRNSVGGKPQIQH